MAKTSGAEANRVGKLLVLLLGMRQPGRAWPIGIGTLRLILGALMAI